jgi:hypothetical protein
MTSTNKLRLCRKLLVLALLCTGLGIALTNSPPQALAAPICQQCLTDFAMCENRCAVDCEGTTDNCFIDCWDECYYGYHGFTYCGGRCVWAPQGGGGGGGDPITFCEFSGSQPAPGGGVYNSISCPNGYFGECVNHPTMGEFCR